MDVSRLSVEAESWARFLFALRDGKPGFIQKIGRRSDWSKMKVGRRRIEYAISPLIVAQIIPVPNAALKLPPQLKMKNWLFSRPVLPNPQSWSRLKQARSLQELRGVAHDIRQWVGRCAPSELPRSFPRILHDHAKDLLKAKRMPNYPRTDRPRSDDKRVEFLAKVLAGLTLGIAPATATKRLGRWVCPNPNLEETFVSDLITIRETLKEK